MKYFGVYRQEFAFKVSYFVLGAKSYVPIGAQRVGTVAAKSKRLAVQWLKGQLEGEVKRLLSM